MGAGSEGASRRVVMYCDSCGSGRSAADGERVSRSGVVRRVWLAIALTPVVQPPIGLQARASWSALGPCPPPDGGSAHYRRQSSDRDHTRMQRRRHNGVPRHSRRHRLPTTHAQISGWVTWFARSLQAAVRAVVSGQLDRSPSGCATAKGTKGQRIKGTRTKGQRDKGTLEPT